MKVISALGGSGSSFLLHALDRQGYRRLSGVYHKYDLKRRFRLSPRLIRRIKSALSSSRLYVPDTVVLRRPDTFWTDWASNPSGRYAPEDSDFADRILAQRDYVLSTIKDRSAGLPIRNGDLSAASMTELVASYLARMEEIEKDLRKQVVLICGHWGEYGILKELGVEAIYLIRDPFNSIVSHSKPVRHQKDYRRRGLTDLNSREWIDNYLVGPHHYWIRHAECALGHANATIIRYQHFPTDWQQVDGLPDISSEFEYRANDIGGHFSPALIDYIYARTEEVCHALGFDEIYHQIRGR